MRTSSTIAALACLVLAAPAVRAADGDTEHISRVMPLAPGGTVQVRNFSGRVTITGGSRGDVSIEATRRAPRWRLDAVKLDIHADGSTLVIEANHKDGWLNWPGRNGVVDTDLDIQVPTRTNVDVKVFSSPLEVTGVEGSLRARGFSARLRLNDILGPVDAHSFSGPVEIRTNGWQDDQRVAVETFSGDVDLRVPESARGKVSFRSFSGRLTADVPMTVHERGRRVLRGQLGGSDDGSLSLKTFSGNVRIKD